MDRQVCRAPRFLAALALLLALEDRVLAAPAKPPAAYVPPAGEWERRRPEQVGLDAARLQEAVDFAVANESKAPRDLEENHYDTFGREPLGHGIGLFKARGPATGLVIRHGYLVAEWGDPDRVDMTFSVTKSFVSTVIGLAWHDGLIRDLHAPVRASMAPVDLPAGDGEPGVDRTGFGGVDPAFLFESEHNRKITWDHLLRQTSDWEGTLWGKPDWADRPGDDVGKNRRRPRNPPGSAYKYNDVRVNLLALAGLSVWRRPLPEVLRERVMDPIGASRTWRWHGYENSWITLDGHRVQSVSGGGHWGGGMFISARDQARFGLFTLRRGRWGDKQLLREDWFRMATTSTPPEPDYGFMNYFLNVPGNDGKRMLPAAPATAYVHLGAGNNIIYVDPENDLVVVARWIPTAAIPSFIEKVLAARTP
jgi:CubicO group peptidase (beta-lactamase class C family)